MRIGKPRSDPAGVLPFPSAGRRKRRCCVPRRHAGLDLLTADTPSLSQAFTGLGTALSRRSRARRKQRGARRDAESENCFHERIPHRRSLNSPRIGRTDPDHARGKRDARQPSPPIWLSLIRHISPMKQRPAALSVQGGEIGNDVAACLLILDPCIRHRGAWHSAARISEVLVERRLVPGQP